MVKTVFIMLFMSLLAYSETPWGTDAFLVPKEQNTKKTPTTPLAQAISFHQHILSPADGPRSHFYPSSSEYGRQAIGRFGPCIGLIITFDRLMRENDERWVYKAYILNDQIIRKYDPVPQLVLK